MLITNTLVIKSLTLVTVGVILLCIATLTRNITTTHMTNVFEDVCVFCVTIGLLLMVAAFFMNALE